MYTSIEELLNINTGAGPSSIVDCWRDVGCLRVLCMYGARHGHVLDRTSLYKFPRCSKDAKSTFTNYQTPAVPVSRTRHILRIPVRLAHLAGACCRRCSAAVLEVGPTPRPLHSRDLQSGGSVPGMTGTKQVLKHVAPLCYPAHTHLTHMRAPDEKLTATLASSL